MASAKRTPAVSSAAVSSPGGTSSGFAVTSRSGGGGSGNANSNNGNSENNGGGGGGRAFNIGSEWHMDDIDQGLAATFEGSLSGLGVDLSSSAFNMSDAIMSLSPGGGKFISSECSESSNFSVLERQLDLASFARDGTNSSKFCFTLSAGTSPAVKVNEEPLTYLNQGQPYEVKLAYNCSADKPRLLKSVLRVSFHERRMQFMEKEHLDYWRQSRPGERILDVDAALSYNVRQVYALPARINVAEVVWEGGGGGGGDGVGTTGSGRGGSTGASSSVLSGGGGGVGSPYQLAAADCGVFVKLHCISTEFTARKHGGEKGIPFRLQIDTYDHTSGEHLCSMAAQVKVFKPKGADRKHKTDREKVEKRSESERSKYLPSLPYTPFLAMALLGDSEMTGAAAEPGIVQQPQQHNVAAFSIGDLPQPPQSRQSLLQQPQQQHHSVPVKQEGSSGGGGGGGGSSAGHSRNSASSLSGGGIDTSPQSPDRASTGGGMDQKQQQQQPIAELSQSSSSQQVAEWLELHRFSGLVRLFQHYNGADMLQLSRADLLEICGVSDGIRLCNAIMQRPCRAKLLFYVGQETENVFHPVYLSRLTYLDLFTKVTSLFQADSDKITQILVYGPGDISVCISDEMVAHMQNEAKFTLHVLADPVNAGRFKIVMKEYRTACED